VFCLAGDILLNFSDQNFLFFIIGGVMFSIARIVMIFNFLIYPFNRRIKWIKIDKIKILFSSFAVYTIFVVTSAFFYIYIKNKMYYSLILIYKFLMYSNIVFSLNRINAINYETMFSTLTAFFGEILFFVSDFLLLVSTFIIKIPYIGIININIYWISMMLLGISIIRNKNKNIEISGNIIEYL